MLRVRNVQQGGGTLLRLFASSVAAGGGLHVGVLGRSAGGLGLGHAPPEGFYDLLPQVFGVGIHAQMMPRGPSTLQTALGTISAPRSGRTNPGAPTTTVSNIQP